MVSQIFNPSVVCSFGNSGILFFFFLLLTYVPSHQGSPLPSVVEAAGASGEAVLTLLQHELTSPKYGVYAVVRTYLWCHNRPATYMEFLVRHAQIWNQNDSRTGQLHIRTNALGVSISKLANCMDRWLMWIIYLCDEGIGIDNVKVLRCHHSLRPLGHQGPAWISFYQWWRPYAFFF